MRSPPRSAWTRSRSASELSPQGRRAGHGSGAGVGAHAGRDDAPGLGGLGPPRPGSSPRRRGRGVAASFTPYGRMCWTRDSASAWVGMELDGTAVVRCAAPDVGGGQTSSLCAITAEVLGLALERVTASGATAISRRAPGRPRPRASSDVGQRGAERGPGGAGHLVGPRPSCWRPPRRTSCWPAGARSSAARRTRGAAGERRAGGLGEGRPVQALEKFDAPSAPTIDPVTGQGRAFNDYTFGTHAVEVEMDEETGRTRVSRIGRRASTPAGHPSRNAEGQLEGGAIQGVGYALMEEVVLDRRREQEPASRRLQDPDLALTSRRSRPCCWSRATGSGPSAPRASASPP